MDTHLLESGNHQHRSLGAAIPSIALHGALILAAIHATAHAALKSAPVEHAPVVRLHPSAPDPTREHSQPSTSFKSEGRWTVPVLAPRESFQLPLSHPDVEAAGQPLVTSGDFAKGAPVVSTGGLPIVADVLSAEQVDRQVAVVPGSPAPSYPDALRAAGVEGTVVAAFVVDTTGHVETGSFKLLAPADDRFVAAVRASLAHTRFIPAESHGAKVRQLVEQLFSFVVR